MSQQIPCPFLVLLLLLLLALDNAQASDSREDNLLRSSSSACSGTTKTQIDLYMMSKSAQGAWSVLALAPLVKMHPHLHLNVSFIASFGQNGTFHSEHGETEVIGDLWELCAIEHYQEHNKFLDFLLCMSWDYQNIPDNAVNCSIYAELDLAVMQACAESQEGVSLLHRSILLSKSIGLPLDEDSVFFVNGARYVGPLNQLAVERAVCAFPVVLDDDKVYQKWWFYPFIGLAVLVGGAVLLAGMLTAYRLYVKCNRASDMWLNMIKNNPGDALNFADKVQDAMYRYENQASAGHGGHGGHGGGYGGPAAGVGLLSPSRERSGEEGYLRSPPYNSVNASDSPVYASDSSPDPFEGSPTAHYYAEESPLLETSWSMGGVRD